MSRLSPHSSTTDTTTTASSDDFNFDARMLKLLALVHSSSKNMTAILNKMEKVEKYSMSALMAQEMELKPSVVTEEKPQ